MSADCACTCGSGGDCGCDECCAGIAVATPVSVANPPGQPSLLYRVGTQPQFASSMRARLASADVPALAALTTRESSDFSIALLEGWATVADVLTFYTERIANEGFLRTATEEFSVRRLAELVGYRPRPGLSATAYLAFTVMQGQPASIPIGTKAQQIPPPGQLPATFETAEALIGHARLSTLAIRRRQPQLLTPRNVSELTHLVCVGNLTDLRPGERIRVEVSDSVESVMAVFLVSGVEVDPPSNITTARVEFEWWDKPDPPAPVPIPPAPGAVIRNGVRPTRLEQLVSALRKPPSQQPRTSADLGRNLTELLAADKGGVTALLRDIVPEVGGSLDTALASSSAEKIVDPSVRRMRSSAMLFGATAPKYPTYFRGKVTGYVDPKVGRGAEPFEPPLPPIQPGKYLSMTTMYLDGVYPDLAVNSTLTLINSVLAEKAEGGALGPVTTRTVKKVATVTVTQLGLSLKVMQLTLDDSWPHPGNRDGEGDPRPEDLHLILDNTVVYFQHEKLDLAGESIDAIDVGCISEPISGKSKVPLIDVGSAGSACGDTVELDGVYPELGPGRWLIVTGERTDAAIKSAQDPDSFGSGTTGVRGGELVMVAAVEFRPMRVAITVNDGEGAEVVKVVDLPGDAVHTFVRFASPLAFTYSRPSVVIYGNVARATHGETRGEVLGSGDPSKPFARYPLKQPPLTYLPAPTAVGAGATLDVFVDSVRWHQADSLLDIGPDDRRYVIDTDDGGNSAVVFGAARPPSGVENIQARYRSGIGRPGNAAVRTIATPLDLPLGVTAVTNPLPATGGADRDGRETVRRNAAVSTLALDRLVSVSDYADFASAYAGVGAANASELSDGRRTVVHVTIAGIEDSPIASTSDLAANLRRALRVLGDPNQEVQVAVRTLRALVVSARVRIDPDRIWSDVEAVVRARLLATFGPGQRDIGRGVAQAEVLAAVHAVPGVIYVDMTVFDSLGEAQLVSKDPTEGLTLRKWVPAQLASFDSSAPGEGVIVPAELVILTPSAPDTFVLEAL